MFVSLVTRREYEKPVNKKMSSLSVASVSENSKKNKSNCETDKIQQKCIIYFINKPLSDPFL